MHTPNSELQANVIFINSNQIVEKEVGRWGGGDGRGWKGEKGEGGG